MSGSTFRSGRARIAFAALALGWAAAGWWITVEQGFTGSLDKRGQHGVFVGGLSGAFMALLFFLLSTLAALVALQSLRASRATCAAVTLLNLGLPALFTLCR